jgi:hypothetical protein
VFAIVPSAAPSIRTSMSFAGNAALRRTSEKRMR